MNNEPQFTWEFYLIRLYWRGDGFWLSVCEAVNYPSEKRWALIQCGWNREDGAGFAVCSRD